MPDYVWMIVILSGIVIVASVIAYKIGYKHGRSSGDSSTILVKEFHHDDAASGEQISKEK